MSPNHLDQLNPYHANKSAAESLCAPPVIPDAVQHAVLLRCSGTHTCCQPQHQPHPAWVPCLRSGTTRRSAHGMTECNLLPPRDISLQFQTKVATLPRYASPHGATLLCLHPRKRRKGTLYVGVTSDLVRRMWQHREGLFEGFTKQHGVTQLVYYEIHEDPTSAIRQEKTHQAMAARLEDQSHPEEKPLLARPLRPPRKRPPLGLTLTASSRMRRSTKCCPAVPGPKRATTLNTSRTPHGYRACAAALRAAARTG
jgi:predicted GIY-YIG superfamily endonuclease